MSARRPIKPKTWLTLFQNMSQEAQSEALKLLAPSLSSYQLKLFAKSRPIVTQLLRSIIDESRPQ